MTTYIETYIFGFGGVAAKRTFTGADNTAGLATTYGNINSSKTNRDNRRSDRNAKEIAGGVTVDGTTKYYTSQTQLDADSGFAGIKLLTNEALHIIGRDYETNTTEVARQAARVTERGTYNAATFTYAGDVGTEKDRVDARNYETNVTEVARQAARVVERGTYNAATFTYAGDVGTEKDREDARNYETNVTEVARQAARVTERGTYNAATFTYAGDVGTEKDRADARNYETNVTEVARQAARVAESGTYNSVTGIYDSTTASKEKDRQDYRNRETADDELTPWDPDNASNANYRTYINFPGNTA